jgi:hypothetical protein
LKISATSILLLLLLLSSSPTLMIKLRSRW